MLISIFGSICAQQTQLGGAPIVINGKVSSGGIDFQVTYNLKQTLVMVFSIADSSSDAIVMDYQSSGTVVYDAFLQSDGSLVTDNAQDIRASALTYVPSAANGIKVKFARDLDSGDTTDFTLYVQTATQVCFFTSTLPYISGINYKGASKVCTYLSLHSKLGENDDRLIGNIIQSYSVGSQQMTIYGSQVQEIGSVQNWLYLTIHYGKMQGSSNFNLRWLRVSNTNAFANCDSVLIVFKADTIVTDNWCTTKNVCDLDTNQGGSSDVFRVAGGFDVSNYQIVTLRRKFITGDSATDSILTAYSIKGLSFQIGNNQVQPAGLAELVISSPDLTAFATLPRTTVGTSFSKLGSSSSSTQSSAKTKVQVIARPVVTLWHLSLITVSCILAGLI